MTPVTPEQTYLRVHRLARRMASHDAEDTAHDAWLILQARAEPGPIADAYLRNALRWARDVRWRAEARRRAREDAAGGADGDDTARLELITAILEALASLTPMDQTLVWQRYVDGRTPDEVADAAGITSTAARQRVSRALAKLRERLDRDYGGRAAWAAIAITADVAPVITAGATPAPLAMATSIPRAGVLIGTLGGLGIAWGMSCGQLGAPASSEPRVVALSAPAADVAAPVSAPIPAPAPSKPTMARRAPVERSMVLAATHAKRFDAASYVAFRKEINDSFVECVREWNEGSGDREVPMSGRTVFIVELDVIPDTRVDVDDVWLEVDGATMRDVVECMQNGLATVSLEPLVGTLPAQIRVVLDGDKHSAIATPVLDLEGLPETLLEDRALLDQLGGWMVGKTPIPAGAEAAVARFSEALADGRIAPGELDDATVAALERAR